MSHQPRLIVTKYFFLLHQAETKLSSDEQNQQRIIEEKEALEAQIEETTENLERITPLFKEAVEEERDLNER